MKSKISPPHGEKLKTLKSADGKRGNAFVAPPSVVQRYEAMQRAKKQEKLQASRAGRVVQRAVPVRQNLAQVEAGKARITLNVESGYIGCGYQLLLDEDCEFAGTFDQLSVGYLYHDAEYTVPEDASEYNNSLETGQTASVDVPAGKYDFYVLGCDTYMSSTYTLEGEAEGDDFEFKSGCEYVFTVRTGGFFENVTLTSVAPVEIGVSGIKSPATGENLTAAEKVTATIFNEGTEPATGFTATFTVDDGQPVTETVTQTVPASGSIDYTFTATADLSAPGMHKITVTVASDDDCLANNNPMTATVNNIAPVPAPYVCEFDEDVDVEEWTVIDKASDKITWKVVPESGFAEIRYNAAKPLDDYLVTSNSISLKAGTSKIVIDYNARERILGDPNYEDFEVLYGKSSDVSSMAVLGKAENFTWKEGGYVLPLNIELDEAGAYYFAIHATSTVGQYGIEVNKVEISEGAFAGTPDLVLDRVVLPMSSCSLTADETVTAEISNNGTGGVAGFMIECTVNGEVKATKGFATAVPAYGNVTVEIEGVDLSAPDKYTVGVRITEVEPAEGQNPEAVTDNNYAEAAVTHFTPVDVPVTWDFNDEAQRADWTGGDSWIYDGEYNSAIYCTGTTPLTSRGVNLEAGKTYRLTYNYAAGAYGGYVSESYDIIIGEDGAPLNEWSVLYPFTNIYTNDMFADAELRFKAPSDGIYSFGFRQETSNGTLNLRSVTVAEVAPYDVTLSVTGIPTKLPKAQAGSMALSAKVYNYGLESVSGTVTVEIGGKRAGSARFEDLASLATKTLSIPVTVGDTGLGSLTVEVNAEIDGHEDGNPADNMVSADVELTEDILAYDHLTDGMYDDNSIGLGDGQECTAGTVFHISKAATLDGLSIGWGEAAGQQIGITAYKWDTGVQSLGVGQYLLDDAVFTATADQGTEIGQHDYMFDEPVTLEPGDYLFTVTYEGMGLAVDRVLPGQLYLLMDSNGTMVAYDQASAGFGTPAIRAILGEATESGVNSVDTGSGTSGIVYNQADNTFVGTSSAGAAVSLDVYSASGAMLGSASSDDGECRFDASRLVPGVYVVKMTTVDGIVTNKFVVE